MKLFSNIDSEHKYIIFLSETTIEYMKTNCCYMCPRDSFKKSHIKKMYDLYQKQRLLTILDSTQIDFKKREIYFDDIETRTPKYDNLYLKINPHFYVSYAEYLQQITKFNFNLHSYVFSKFGLKRIKCEFSSHISEKRHISNQLDAGIGKFSIQYNKNNDKKVAEIIAENFNIDSNDYLNIMNVKDMGPSSRKKYIMNNLLPMNNNDENIMFQKALNMNNISKIVDENIESVTYTFHIVVHEIKSILIGLGELYSPLNITNDFKYELETKTEHFIRIDYEFYDIKELKEHYESTEICRKEYYLSSSHFLKGPWPLHCKKVFEKNLIRKFNTALKISTEKVNESPKTIVNEIRNDFDLYNGITYSVISWELTDTPIDIKVGGGIRYLHFSNIRFEERNRLVELLRNTGYN